MFSLITKNKMKRLMIFKYVYQLFLVIIVFGVAGNLAIIPLFWLGWGDDFVERFFILEPAYLGMFFIGAMTAISGGFLSYVPFVKLVADGCSKNDEEASVIQIERFRINYEMNGFLTHKRFWCDTFLRKENLELLVYDTAGGKYRLNWNENYGSFAEAKKILDCPKVAIRYFKRSKIIFDCKVIDGEEQLDEVSLSS